MQHRLVSTVLQLAAAALVCSGLSCAKSDRPELGYVTGVVRLDGEPVPGCIVYFSPQGGGRTSAAMTDDAGKYDLIYIGTDRGAKIGRHTVHLSTSKETEDPETGQPIHTPELIPAKYREKSEYTVDVEPGEQVIDITLES